MPRSIELEMAESERWLSFSDGDTISRFDAFWSDSS